MQSIASGCCDFLAQCILVRTNHCNYHPFYSPKSSKIYRCWIIWGQNIRVVIIPLFLAVAYLGRSIYLHLIFRFQFIASSWLVPTLNVALLPFTTTSFAVTMAVNALVTGLIVFRILKVFLEVKAASTSVERSLGSAGGSKIRHIIFVIIESGMTLLVIQLVRMVLEVIVPSPSQSAPGPVLFAYQYVLLIGEMFNVIIRSVHFYFFCFTEKNYLARASHQQ